MQPSSHILEIDNLTFERNNQIVLNEIQSTLHSGEILQIQGANGSGKSTLLRILAGLIEPQAGTVFWNRRCIFQQREEYHPHFHYLGHQNGNKLALTVQENLHLAAALNKHRVDVSYIKHILKKMGLTHAAHLLTLKLSAGQSRRLALAKLLLQERSLWILDEPNTALDSEGQALLGRLLHDHLHHGGMAVIATHQPLSISYEVKSIQLGDARG